MQSSFDLKNVERQAWTAYYQDGLWDIYLGLLLFVAALMSTTLDGLENTLVRLLLYAGLAGGSYLLFWAGRRFLTFPRLGRARFGAERRRKKARLSWVMAGFVALNLLLLALTAAANRDPQTWGRWMPSGWALMLLVGGFIGSVMACTAYFNDFTRGYYIAAVFALTFPAAEVFNSSAVFWVGGALVLLPGLVLLTRFLAAHPRAVSAGPQ
jgi:hypothetical protein